MNKEELINSIKDIPKFRLRDVAVKQEFTEEKDGVKAHDWFEQEHLQAVTEIDKLKAIATVSEGYFMIQFADVFLPIIGNMPELDGEVLYDNGFAYLYVFPTGDEYKQGNDEFGAVVMNSVNTSSSVIIRFIVKHNNKKILLPKKISGFKRTHKGQTTLSLAKDYLYNMDKIKETWATIVDKFSKEKLTSDHIKDMELDKGIAKNLKKRILSIEMNLWDGFMYVLDYISGKEYKTEVHKRKKLDKVCEAIIDYGLVLKI